MISSYQCLLVKIRLCVNQEIAMPIEIVSFIYKIKIPNKSLFTVTFN